jgi:hypothetical protein
VGASLTPTPMAGINCLGSLNGIVSMCDIVSASRICLRMNLSEGKAYSEMASLKTLRFTK